MKVAEESAGPHICCSFHADLVNGRAQFMHGSNLYFIPREMLAFGSILNGRNTVPSLAPLMINSVPKGMRSADSTSRCAQKVEQGGVVR
jgi:hypothetical protein